MRGTNDIDSSKWVYVRSGLLDHDLSGGSRSIESRLVERVLDNVTQSLPEVVGDVAIKNRQLTDEYARLQQELHSNQVLLNAFIRHKYL